MIYIPQLMDPAMSVPCSKHQNDLKTGRCHQHPKDDEPIRGRTRHLRDRSWGLNPQVPIAHIALQRCGWEILHKTLRCFSRPCSWLLRQKTVGESQPPNKPHASTDASGLIDFETTFYAMSGAGLRYFKLGEPSGMPKFYQLIYN